MPNQFRAGDVIKHIPSGEEWMVASVSPLGEHICAAGWPETVAPVTDIQLVEAVSDERHLKVLLQVAKRTSTGSTRQHWAFENLVALCPPDIIEKRDALLQACSLAYEAHQRARLDCLNFEERIIAGDFTQ